MASRRKYLAVSASLFGLAGCTDSIRSSSVGGTGFPSEDIKWLVPSSPGGGFDAYSRAIAEHLPKHLPNEVNVVVENQSAAGGQVHATEIYNGEPDGHLIGIWNMPGQIVAQILSDDPEYDTSEITWLAQVIEEPYMFVVGKDTPYESIEDLQAADEVKLGGQGPGNTGDLMNMITAEELEFNLNHVRGFEGNSELYSSVLRGEIEGFCGSIGSTQIIQGVEEGDLRVMIGYMEDDRVPDWAEGTPTAPELGYDDLVGVLSNFRVIGGPPDIDESIAETLEDSLMATLESDDLQSWADDAGRPLLPLGSSETADNIDNMFKVVDQYGEVFEEGGW